MKNPKLSVDILNKYECIELPRILEITYQVCVDNSKIEAIEISNAHLMHLARHHHGKIMQP